MRVTVYIPDDLLEEARKLQDGEKTSQLVQRGLQRLLEDDATKLAPAYARRPQGWTQQVLAAREHFVAEAEVEYEKGFAAALEVANLIPLGSLNMLAERNFDVRSWLEPQVAGLRNDEVQKALADLERLSPEERANPLALMHPEKTNEPIDEESETSWIWNLWIWKLPSTLGRLADPIGFDQFSFEPTDARVKGFADCLREIWMAIERPEKSGVYSELRAAETPEPEAALAEGGGADDEPT
jgi:hypothetical protein